jgi:SAM-dependent methyltransferase
MKKLNLGCGSDYKEGWLNVDVLRGVRADKHFSLDKYPWPLKNNSFNQVLMKSVLEHLENPINALKEVIRISRDKARLTVIVPHARNYAYLSDLQHKTNFTETSFNKNLLEEYDLNELILVDKKFVYWANPWKRYIPFKGFLKIFLNGIYDEILFEFEVKK